MNRNFGEIEISADPDVSANNCLCHWLDRPWRPRQRYAVSNILLKLLAAAEGGACRCRQKYEDAHDRTHPRGCINISRVALAIMAASIRSNMTPSRATQTISLSLLTSNVGLGHAVLFLVAPGRGHNRSASRHCASSCRSPGTENETRQKGQCRSRTRFRPTTHALHIAWPHRRITTSFFLLGCSAHISQYCRSSVAAFLFFLRGGSSG